jgi:hypothetical protein
VPLGGFFVFGGGPFIGPVFDGKHKAQGPDLRKGWNFFAGNFGALFWGQAGNGTAHIHDFGGIGAVFVEGFDFCIKLEFDFAKALLPQVQKLHFLSFVRKTGAVIVKA